MSGRVYMKSRRFYRCLHQGKRGWVAFQVKHKETDLWIGAWQNLEKEALSEVLTCRHQLESYMARVPGFLGSLAPLPEDPMAPPLLRTMLSAAREAGVGPMASVAGAIAQAVGVALKPHSTSVIVENGGDCYLDMEEETTVGIYAGPRSPFSGKLGIRLAAGAFPLGVCTSSGTVGHSLSFGKADAVTVTARDAALADAAATSIGNIVKSPSQIGEALERAREITSLLGVFIAVKDKMGAWGDMELVRL